MTDEEIRRDVLERNGWDPDEIDRYLIEHPKPDTLFEQAAILHERLIDVGRAMWQERFTFLAIYAALVLSGLLWWLLLF